MTIYTYIRCAVLRFRLQIAATDLGLMERMAPQALLEQRQRVADLERRLRRAERAAQGDAHA